MNTRKLFPLAAILLPATALSASAQKPSIDLALDPYSLTLSDYCFPSGLRVLFQEDHTQPLVNITQVIDRGSDADPPGLEGIAHVVEHLWFRSYVEGENKVWDKLKEVGASLNAYTASDVTTYLTAAPVWAMGDLLALEARRIMGAKSVENVTQEEVNLEREIARNELRMRYENTQVSGIGYLYGKLFPEGHPYASLGIGTHDSLDNITIEDVQKFTDEHYRPANTTMLVIGDFSVKDSWKFIAEHFPMELLVDPENPDAELELIDCPQRIDPTTVPPEPPEPVDQGISYHKAGVEKTTVLVGWSLPGGYRTDASVFPAAGVNLNLVVNAFLNPDFDWATDSIEDLTGAECGVYSEEHASIGICGIEVGASTDPEDALDDVLDALYLQWETNFRVLQGDYISKLVKAQMMVGTFQSVENVASIFGARGNEVAVFTHMTGDPAYFSRQIEAANQIDYEKVAAVGHKYLVRDRAVAVILEPYEDGDLLIDSSDQSYKGRPFEGTVETKLDLENVTAEVIRDNAIIPNLDRLRQVTLDNGLDVFIYPYGDAPLVTMGLVFDQGGDLSEPLPELAEFAWDMTDHYLKGQMNTPLRMAGGFSSFYNDTHTILAVNGSSANMAGLTWMLREQVRVHEDPNSIQVEYKKEYFDTWIKSLRAARKTPENWVSWVRNERLFGADHALGHMYDEFELDAMRGYGKSDIKPYYDALFRPDNASLWVIGKIDPDVAEQAVRDLFGDWSAGDPVDFPFAELPEPPPPPERAVIVMDNGLVSQTQVSFGCQIAPWTQDNQEIQDVLGRVLSEMAWDALREKSGVSYGAGSGVSRYPGGSTVLSSGVLVQNDSAGVAAQTFMDQAARVQSGDFPQDLIPLMKVTEARGTVLSQQTALGMLNNLTYPLSQGWSLDWLNTYPERMAAVTLADVQGQLDRCIGHEIVTLLGPVEVITPQLDELGLSYEVFDWDAERKALWEKHDPKGYAKAKKKADKAKAKAEKKKASDG